MPAFHLIQKDITSLQVDAIVNAANGRLEGGGGVDGAIHRAAGPELKKACIDWKRDNGVEFLPSGEATYTEGFGLPARYVIHTVGPVWNGGDHHEPEKLRSCYSNCLSIAEKLGCHSIAFPNISTGVYRFPKEEAARIAHETLSRFQFEHIKDVFLVCFDEDNYRLYQQLF